MSDISDIMWVEKHRPETLDEIIGNNMVVEQLSDYTDRNDMPHIMLAGPQGTGKTALIQAFSKEKYGDDWRHNVKEMNASDDRGIDIVREDIKGYAKQSPVGPYEFKIIFLDEADSLTKDAFQALRRVMEDWSDTTRFFLSCNYPNQIIAPIQSRCSVFKMERLGTSDIMTLLERVVDREGIEASEEDLRRIAEMANGDGRRAINSLQTATVDSEVKSDYVQEVRTLDYQQVAEIYDEAISGDVQDAIDEVQSEIIKSGINEQEFLELSLSHIKRMDIPGDAKCKIIDKIGEAEHRLNNGDNPNIQLASLLAKAHVARHLSIDAYDN